MWWNFVGAQPCRDRRRLRLLASPGRPVRLRAVLAAADPGRRPLVAAGRRRPVSTGITRGRPRGSPAVAPGLPRRGRGSPGRPSCCRRGRGRTGTCRRREGPAPGRPRSRRRAPRAGPGPPRCPHHQLQARAGLGGRPRRQEDRADGDRARRPRRSHLDHPHRLRGPRVRVEVEPELVHVEGLGPVDIRDRLDHDLQLSLHDTHVPSSRPRGESRPAALVRLLE